MFPFLYTFHSFQPPVMTVKSAARMFLSVLSVMILPPDYTFRQFYSNLHVPDRLNCLFPCSMVDYLLHAQMYL